MRVSCLILTFNEEMNIGRCLQSLDWCDDITLVDSGSTDRTLEIALEFGARVLSRPFDNFANQRNYGLDAGDLKHEWVLHLDADEVSTDAFALQIEQLEPAEGIDGYYVPSKTMLHGKWLRYAGMYPSYQARLGHRERMHFSQVGHGQREDVPPARMGHLKEPYLHFNFSHGMRKWLEKHVRYADDEAQVIADLRSEKSPDPKIDQSVTSNAASKRRKAKVLAAKLPLHLRPLARFLYVYIWRKGFLDGRAGFTYAFMLAVYESMTAIMADERINTDG